MRRINRYLYATEVFTYVVRSLRAEGFFNFNVCKFIKFKLFAIFLLPLPGARLPIFFLIFLASLATPVTYGGASTAGGFPDSQVSGVGNPPAALARLVANR
ncbi:MAG: hypothetical protein KME49_18420 [Brasilonema octagenarum HA4186-MV1]|jgi:hypothetical protein|nr:hypothetical protein [Brasilonema octagenarum HA4186-MV1]